MRKNLLALSIAAMVGGLSGAANAAVGTDTIGFQALSTTKGRLIVNSPNTAAATWLNAPAAPASTLTVQSNAVGHILVVPYFTTQSNNATLLNLVNTDLVNGKAVKLRFRGAANSDDLFDITVYLSPGDMWTANVSANGDISALSTSDTSCTLPKASEIKEVLGKFKTNRVNGDVAQTREGYVEILNMADVPPTRVLNAAGQAANPGIHNTANPLFTATKHANSVAPCTQATMDLQANALVAQTANDPALRGYSWPTGGLTANWTIVNVADKASFSGQAVAVAANGPANLVWSPQTTEAVSIQQAQLLSADPLFGTNATNKGFVRAASYDFPDLSTPYAGDVLTPSAQANLLAGALSTTSLSNEFLTDQSVQFATDWVFSMPTRRYAVAMDYETKALVENEEKMTVGDQNAAFALWNYQSRSGYFRSTGNNVNVALNQAKTRICVDSGQLQAFDREENTRTSFVISPDSLIQFCGETTVLTFNNADYSVLGGSLSKMNVETKFVDGWFRVATPGIGAGLPVVGFAAAKLRGANMGGAWAHRGSK